LALHSLAAISPLAVLLFSRVEIAERLDLLGAVVGETSLFAVVAVLSGLAAARTRSKLPAGVLLWLGALLAAIGLGLAAWTIDVNLFLVGGTLYAVGAGPVLTLPRVVLAGEEPPATRFRTMSLYWAAVAVGVGWPLAAKVVADPAYSTILWISCVLMILAAVALTPVVLVNDNDTQF